MQLTLETRAYDTANAPVPALVPHEWRDAEAAITANLYALAVRIAGDEEGGISLYRAAEDGSQHAALGRYLESAWALMEARDVLQMARLYNGQS